MPCQAKIGRLVITERDLDTICIWDENCLIARFRWAGRDEIVNGTCLIGAVAYKANKKYAKLNMMFWGGIPATSFVLGVRISSTITISTTHLISLITHP